MTFPTELLVMILVCSAVIEPFLHAVGEASGHTLLIEPRAVEPGKTNLPLPATSRISMQELETIMAGVTGLANRIVSPNVQRACLRSLLLENRKDFRHLTGEQTELLVTPGILTRIVHAIRQLETDGSTPIEASPRRRELADIAARQKTRIEEAKLIPESRGFTDAMKKLNPETWESLFPDVDRVVFRGFDHVDEGTLSLIHLLDKMKLGSFFILDYDPDAPRFPHLSSAYDQLYDLAEAKWISESDLPGEIASCRSAEMKCHTGPILVRARTRRQETNGIVQLAAKRAASGMRVGIVVADPPFYLPAIIREARRIGIPPPHNMLPARIDQTPPGAFLGLLRTVAFADPFEAVGKLFSTPAARIAADITTEKIGLPVEGLEAEFNRIRKRTLLRGKSAGLADLFTAAKEYAMRRFDPETESEGMESVLPRLSKIEKAAETAQRFVQVLRKESSFSEWESRIGEWLGKIRREWSRLPDLSFGTRLSVDAILFRTRELTHSARLFDTMTPSAVEYLGHLLTALHDDHIIQVPDPAPGQILLLDPSQAADVSVDCLIWAGLNDGKFPAFRPLNSQLIPGLSRHEQRIHSLSFQRHTFLSTLNESRRETWLTVPESDRGEVLLESQFLHEFPDHSLSTIRMDQLVEFLEGLPLSDRKSDSRPGIEHFPLLTSANVKWNRQANRARRSDVMTMFDGNLSEPDILNWLSVRASKGVFSFSRLDLLVQCPFRYLVENIMHLKSDETEDDLLAPMEYGTLVHDILSSFYQEWISEMRKLPEADTMDQALEAIRFHAERAFESAGLSSFQEKIYRLRLLGKTEPENQDDPRQLPLNKGALECFLAFEKRRSEEMKGDGFVPAYFEAGFGMEGEDQIFSSQEPLELETPLGTVKLKGRIDRIDVLGDTFLVIDYKQVPLLPTCSRFTTAPVSSFRFTCLLSKPFLAHRGIPPRPQREACIFRSYRIIRK